MNEKETYQDILNAIPNAPAVNINNYLLDLVEENDGKRSSIYINGAEKVIQETWNEIIEKNWRKLNVRKLFPEKFNIACSVFYQYKKGKKAIPVQTMHSLLLLWKKLCRKSVKDVERNWKKIFEESITFSSAYGHKVQLPKVLTPKLSYLIGFMLGDGCLRACSNRYLIQIVDESYEFLNSLISPIFEDLFTVKPKIYPKSKFKRSYSVQFSCKPIFRFFTNIIKFPLANTSRKIPKIIQTAPLEIKKYFLIGFFDAEGCVIHDSKAYQVTLTQNNPQLLQDIKKLLLEFGIFFNGPYLHKAKTGKWYTIRIKAQSSLNAFYNKVNFQYMEKKLKLKKAVKLIENNRNSQALACKRRRSTL